MFQLFFFQTCQNIGGTFLLHPRNLTETYRYQKWPYLKPASTGYPRPIILGPSCEVAPIVASWTWWGEPCIESWFVAPKIADIWSSGNIGYHWIFLGIFWLMMVDVFCFSQKNAIFRFSHFLFLKNQKNVRLFSCQALIEDMMHGVRCPALVWHLLVLWRMLGDPRSTHQRHLRTTTQKS